jgi:hypothetical protein
LYFIYRITEEYDGFTPDQISSRLKTRNFIYNWMQYYDEASRGDIVFTYFMGKHAQGIYLISKITKKEANNRIIAKVLCYDQKKPLMSKTDFEQIYKLIFNRPRGSVFAIPTFLDNVFDKLLNEKVSSDIVISENIDCNACVNRKKFPCDKCSIFDRDYLINWQREVQLSIPEYEGVVSPFWIIPYQSHWTKTSISQHIVSRIFYSFKSGYTLYGRLFARGIKKAIENDPLLQQVKFDCILEYRFPLENESEEKQIESGQYVLSLQQ